MGQGRDVKPPYSSLAPQDKVNPIIIQLAMNELSPCTCQSPLSDAGQKDGRISSSLFGAEALHTSMRMS